MNLTNRSAPAATVVPVLVYADVSSAVEFLCNAFGFTVRLRARGPNDVLSHAQLAIAEGAIMLGRAGGPFHPPRAGEVSQYVAIHVPDVDAHFERARAAGATIVSRPNNMPFGERQYTAQDPEGHRWTFSQHIADLAPEDWGATSG
jgi:uncharacterized glyoxalase superfamily protein PhnB